jgi:acetyltransferase-like isoleucine patch superfamily enzyme
VCQKFVTLGAKVMVGGGSEIVDTDFHPLDPVARLRHDAAAVATAPVVIGDEAWIGGRVLVLKGVTIGARAIIGAGAVVTRDVPTAEVWAGNPARRIRGASVGA